MSACQATSDIPLIIINVWNGNTTCQLLPKLPSYYVLKFTNLIAQLKKYVHYRNTHTYTHYYSYIIIYLLLLLFSYN